MCMCVGGGWGGGAEEGSPRLLNGWLLEVLLVAR